MTVHNPGHLLPGLEGKTETQRATQQVTGATASHQFTFTLEAGHALETDMVVLASGHVSAKSGGSASTNVTTVVIDSVTTTTVLVTVTLDAAPVGAETTDIACSLLVAGPAGAA